VIEDKLTQGQRIRLEAIAQTNVSFAMHRPTQREFEEKYKNFVKLIQGDEEELYYDDNTMAKVRSSLREAGFDEGEITNAIRIMQNDGILFRERAKD
jgi:hypothetical protein